MQPGHIGLIDVRIDDQVVEVGDGEHLGAGIETARSGNSLPYRDGASENRGIEGGHHLGLAQSLDD